MNIRVNEKFSPTFKKLFHKFIKNDVCFQNYILKYSLSWEFSEHLLFLNLLIHLL